LKPTNGPDVVGMKINELVVAVGVGGSGVNVRVCVEVGIEVDVRVELGIDVGKIITFCIGAGLFTGVDVGFMRMEMLLSSVFVGLGFVGLGEDSV